MRPALLLAVALLSGACTYFGQQKPGAAADDAWVAARDRATRTEKLYSQLNDIAFATAVYQSPAVRAARVERIAAWKGSLPAEKQAALDREKAEAAEGEEFLLAFFTDDRRANDLASGKSTWRVGIVVNGTEQATATKITFLRPDPTLQVLYPWITEFDTLYRVRFPKLPGPTPLAELPFQLRIAGALGALDLDFGPGPR